MNRPEHDGATPTRKEPHSQHAHLSFARYAGPLAAAVILLAVILASQMRIAKAVDLQQIYQAAAKIKDLCTVSVRADDGRVLQKIWTSRSLGIIVFETGNQFVLWDLPHRVKKTRHTNSREITETALSDEQVAKLRRSIEHAAGLVPFTKFEDLQEGAQWTRLEAADSQSALPGSIVYELTWAASEHLTRKWRVFLDPKTLLPLRTEDRSKHTTDEEYLYSTATVVKYVDQMEIEEVIQKWFTQ